MAERALHIVSSIGDVTARPTWSGTPFGIWSGLERRRPGVVLHAIGTSYRFERLLGLVNAAMGLGAHNPTRVGFGHWLQRRRAQRIADRAGAGDFLHFGSGHLPIRARAGQRHYLFTDYSAYLMAANPAYRAQTNHRHRVAVEDSERRLAGSVDGIFVTADYVADGFARRYGLPPDKAFAVKSGLGRVLPDPANKRYEGGYLLFVAKQNFINKGGRLLLDAFDIVRQARPDARLVMIGNESDPTQAGDLARMKGTPGITFHNWDTPDYQDLVAGAALYVGPAPDEPWGIIYLESLSVRTPILGLATNAFPQFVADGAHGFTALAATPDAVAATILDAMSDPARLAAMGAAGRAHVRGEYSWDRVAEHILARMGQGG